MSDLISRADAIEALGEEPEVWTDTEEEWAYRNAWVEHISAIKSLPSAEPPYQYSEAYVNQLRGERDILQDMVNNMAEPKTGEWIGYNADKGDSWLRTDGTPIFLVCDKCNATVLSNGSAHWNFCPNCGARMRGEEE